MPACAQPESQQAQAREGLWAVLQQNGPDHLRFLCCCALVHESHSIAGTRASSPRVGKFLCVIVLGGACALHQRDDQPAAVHTEEIKQSCLIYLACHLFGCAFTCLATMEGTRGTKETVQTAV